MDSEYSPVCSDIEDDVATAGPSTSSGEVASNVSNPSGDEQMASTSGTLAQSSEILRLLDECSRVDSVLDDAEQSEDDELENGLFS